MTEAVGRSSQPPSPRPGHATTPSPYFGAMFPPRQGSAFDSWKRKSTGANVARRLWEQRQRLRQEYEAVHGTNLARWPVRHPGVVLDAVQWVAQPACLGCTWFDEVGVSMKKPDWLDEATERARRHQDSNGAP